MGKCKKMTHQYPSVCLLSIPAVLSIVIRAKKNFNKEFKGCILYSYTQENSSQWAAHNKHETIR